MLMWPLASRRRKHNHRTGRGGSTKATLFQVTMRKGGLSSDTMHGVACDASLPRQARSYGFIASFSEAAAPLGERAGGPARVVWTPIALGRAPRAVASKSRAAAPHLSSSWLCGAAPPTTPIPSAPNTHGAATIPTALDEEPSVNIGLARSTVSSEGALRRRWGRGRRGVARGRCAACRRGSVASHPSVDSPSSGEPNGAKAM